MDTNTINSELQQHFFGTTVAWPLMDFTNDPHLTLQLITRYKIIVQPLNESNVWLAYSTLGEMRSGVRGVHTSVAYAVAMAAAKHVRELKNFIDPPVGSCDNSSSMTEN